MRRRRTWRFFLIATKVACDYSLRDGQAELVWDCGRLRQYARMMANLFTELAGYNIIPSNITEELLTPRLHDKAGSPSALRASFIM